MAHPLVEEFMTINNLSEKLLPGQNAVSVVEQQVGEEHVFLDEELRPTSWHKGESQPKECRDSVFAILFLAQFAWIVGAGTLWGIPALKHSVEDFPDTPNLHFGGVLWVILWSFIASIVLSGVALLFMTKFADFVVQSSVLFSISSSLTIMTIFLARGYVGAAVVAFCSFLLGCCYTWSVWNRLPFTATNLVTALTALQTNWGVLLIPYIFSIVAFGYSLIWTLAMIGAYTYAKPICNDSGFCHSSLNGGVIAIFLLAFYWTQQVIKNIIHVTVAGVVGSWWFVPQEANSGCSKSVGDSFVRSMTSSFGSICMGSLLVSLVQVLHCFAAYGRPETQNDSVLKCIFECLLDYLDQLIQYFNKWSYVYVGLYGYSYREAGEKVMALFTSRGWDAILSDQLVYRVLSLLSFVIGGITGLVSVLVVKAHPSLMSALEKGDASWMAFFCGLLMGSVVSGILMSVVVSAVDTVVVCFAESPWDLCDNHPVLSQRMEQTWAATYPQEYRFISESTVV